MTGYSPLLLGIAFAIALFGSFATLSLGQRVRIGGRTHSLSWLAGGALGVGTGLWAQYFLPLMACNLPIQVAYDVRYLGLSYVIAVATSAIAVRAIMSNRASATGLVPAG